MTEDHTSVLRDIAKAISSSPNHGKQLRYLQLTDAILSAIDHGQLQPGTRLPADSAFAKALPFSLGTIQKALQRLANDGIITRHYRRGTFVRSLAIEKGEIRNFRFLDDDGGKLLPVYVRALDMHVVKGDESWGKVLNINRESKFIRIRRICNIDHRLPIYLESYLPAKRFLAIKRLSLWEFDGQPLTHMLETRFRTPTHRTVHRFRVGRLSNVGCKVLEIPPVSIGLQWELLGYSNEGKLVMYQRAEVPPSEMWLEVLSNVR
jgi:GntR family transcriptional regulator